MNKDSSQHLQTDLGRNARKFWQIPPRGWWNILRRTVTKSGKDNVNLLAAGVAFYTFLAFVPFLASIVLLYGLAANPEMVAGHILLVMTNLPDEVGSIIADQLRNITSTATSDTSLGLLFAIALSVYGTTRGSASIIEALNIIYDETEKRGFFKLALATLLLAILAIILAVGVLLVVGFTTVVQTSGLIEGIWPQVIAGISWIAAASLISLFIATVYRYAPSRANAKWTWLTPGALFASFGCFGGTAAFGYYVSTIGNYSATYGALGGVVTFLMWIYVSTYIVLLGAELNAEIEHQTARDTTQGIERPLGERNAIMADTVQTGPNSG